jgi:hypothetical protein
LPAETRGWEGGDSDRRGLSATNFGGFELATIALQLGHESLGSTDVYLEAGTELR